jgi:hypothetical protein
MRKNAGFEGSVFIYSLIDFDSLTLKINTTLIFQFLL